MAQIEAPSIII